MCSLAIQYLQKQPTSDGWREKGRKQLAQRMLILHQCSRGGWRRKGQGDRRARGRRVGELEREGGRGGRGSKDGKRREKRERMIQ